VPAGPRPAARPASVTLLAPANRDALVAALARDLHPDNCLGATGWRRRPRAAPPADDGERIEIAVGGAHLFGMPLNGELTALGARFARATHTEPGYRLYALAGQTPPKPGLIRDETGSGGVRSRSGRWTSPLSADLSHPFRRRSASEPFASPTDLRRRDFSSSRPL
jgi:allophanate hydrolase